MLIIILYKQEKIFAIGFEESALNYLINLSRITILGVYFILIYDVLKGLLEECEYVMKEEVHDVFVSNLGASSVDLNVRFWVKSSDYWPAKAYITENVKLRLDANNIEIPYNKLDVYVQK